MKKRNLLYAALILAMVVGLSSCFHRHHDVHVRINDDEDVYRLRASFDKDLTRDVQRVINDHLRKHQAHAFVTVYTDKEITLVDGTSFYIKSGPGRLRIKVDRTSNPEEGNEAVIEMCDEIKEVLAGRYDNQ